VVAYPAAAERVDRQLVTHHRVPLLGVGAGETVHLQLLDEPSGGGTTVSREYSFTFTNATDQRPVLRWTMIDVGFGDSHLLTMPGTNQRILIDAGERRDWVNVNRYLSDAAITRLDAVVATHIHADHIGGMIGDPSTSNDGVLGAYPVDAFLEGPAPSASRDAYDELLALLALRGIARRTILSGDSEASNPALAWDPDVHVRALNAGGGKALGGDDDDDWINNDSVVLRIGFGDVELVLGGDAEGPAENRILGSGYPLDSEVLKIHHHGVNDASSAAYLDGVNPRVGLIPITSYESFSGTLPTTAVLGRMHERHVHVYASDRAEPLGIALTGDRGINITLVTDGASYQVEIAPSASIHTPGAPPAPATGAGDRP
jgi:beta-lactamase superfamily II metal-dependent hydrolase